MGKYQQEADLLAALYNTNNLLEAEREARKKAEALYDEYMTLKVEQTEKHMKQLAEANKKLAEAQEKVEFWKKSSAEWKLAYVANGGTASESGIEELEAIKASVRDEVMKELEGQEPVAWMYPSDLRKFEETETFAHAFSVQVGSPDEDSVPVFRHPAPIPAGMQLVHVEPTVEGVCSIHPDAPHGFDRNGSHSAGRYVCECESWTPAAKGEK